MPRPSIAGAAVAVLLVSLSASYRARADTDDDAQLRDPVIECEDAYARLVACCPGFSNPKVQCRYEYSSGCGVTSTTSPGLSQRDAACIRDLTCSELVRTKVCERAASAADRSTTTGEGYGSGYSYASSGTTSPAERVCP
ncbi:MAG: hypothetical protein JST00_04020 [Deltaproteobacteria bacterium]|nr:hypothetical protein [Deltaproteobacteria bacterium]